MDWKDIAGAVGKAAPMLGTLLGGPAGAAVGALVASALGTENDPAAVGAALADPASAVKLREIEAARSVKLQELMTQQAAAELADVASARDRDVKLRQAGAKNVRADLMVLLDVVGLIACLVVIALYRDKLPGEVVGIISTVAGIFGACLRDAHQFEFGSSRSSREKDATIARAVGQQGGL
jgi:hypothetical protein